MIDWVIKIDEVQTVLQSTGPSKEDENMDMNKNESKADKKGKDKREKHSESCSLAQYTANPLCKAV